MRKKNQSMNGNAEMIQIFELCDKGFKVVIIKMCQQTIINMLEQFCKWERKIINK